MPGENIQDWSTTAATNATADSLINWAEGQARNSVNNSARSMMAAHAKNRNLLNGSIVTTGTANAQAFLSGLSYTTVPTGLRVLLKIGAGLTNTAATTLNMDFISDVAIKDQAGADLTAGALTAGAYATFLYNGTNWILLTDTRNKVNVTGDTMTGALTAPTLTATGTVTGGVLAVGGQSIYSITAERVHQFSPDGWRLSWNPVNGFLTFYRYDAFPLFVADNLGNFVIGANGWKPGGGVWADSSDLRVKTVLGDYTAGLDQIKDLAPVRYTFKGNDGEHVADGKEYIGLIAQDVEATMPEMVTTKAGKIDGKPVADMRVLDTGALIYALVNSVQELLTRIEALEAK